MWLRDEATGEIVLRDDAGTKHARYEGAGAVFSDFAPLLKAGTDSLPADHPEALLNGDVTPRVIILKVPESAGSLADLGVVTNANGGTVPATERYPTNLTDSNRGVTTEDECVNHDEDPLKKPHYAGRTFENTGRELDVPDRAARLLGLLREHGEPVTTREALDLAAEHDEDLDRPYQTARKWVLALVDEVRSRPSARVRRARRCITPIKPG